MQLLSAVEESKEVMPLYGLCHTMERFSQRVRDAALSLYTISYACEFLPGVKESQCRIASGLFALAGVASCLHVYLVESSSTASSEQTLKDTEEVEKYIGKCEFILEKIDVGVQIADKYVKPGSNLPFQKGLHRLSAFKENEIDKAQLVVRDCIHVFARMTMASRMESLGRRAELTDDETFEGLRLNGALKRAELKTTLPKQNIAQSQASSPFQPQTNIFPAWECSQSLPHRTSEVAKPFLSFTPVLDDYQLIHPDEATSPVIGELHPEDTPASSRESTPDANGLETSASDPTLKSSQAKKITDDSQNSIPKAKSDIQPTGRTTSAPGDIIPTKIPKSHSPLNLERTHDLEAYILQLKMVTSAFLITWSTEIEPLYLDETAMQAHIDKLGTDHSIVDALGKLLPNQVHRMQEHAKTRGANIVSAQHSAPVDMVTQMGTIQAKPIIFILSRPKISKNEKPGETHIPKSGFSFPPPVSGGFNNGFSGFGPPKSSPFSPFCSSFFPTNDPAQTDPFSALRHANAYKSPFSKDQKQIGGEAAFLVECDHNGTHRYMTITTDTRSSYANNSLEEIRVNDYKAGRTEPSNQDEKPFGGQYFNPKTSPGDRWFGTPPTTTGNLFGNGPSSWQQRPSGGLFGHPWPSNQGQQSTGSLFGRPCQSNQNQPVFGGLFGKPKSPQQPQQATSAVFGQPSPIRGPFSGFVTHNTTSGNSFAQTLPKGPGLFGQSPNPPLTNCLFGKRENVPLTGLFGEPTPAPSSSLFGSPPTDRPTTVFCGPSSKTQGSTTSLFGQTANQTWHNNTLPSYTLSSFCTFGSNAASTASKTNLFASTSSSSSSSTTSPLPLFNQVTPNAASTSSPISHHGVCKNCSTSLIFHLPDEQSASLCSACNGDKKTSCWLCERIIESNKLKLKHDVKATHDAVPKTNPRQPCFSFGGVSSPPTEEEKEKDRIHRSGETDADGKSGKKEKEVDEEVDL